VTSKFLSVHQRVHCHTAHLELNQRVSTDQVKFLSLVASDTINRMTNSDNTLRKNVEQNMQQLHIMSIAFPINVTEAMLGKHRPLVEYSRNTGMISQRVLNKNLNWCNMLTKKPTI
jgi:hypothetical protein